MRLRWTAAFLVILLAFASSSPTFAQRLISTLSSQEISIDSNFTGESLTLFGNVEPTIGGTRRVQGPFDVIITIHGPDDARVVRRKSRQLGVWLNNEGVDFTDLPSFYHVLSSQPLEQIASSEILEEHKIGFAHQIHPLHGSDDALAAEFSEELIRLMTESNMFGLNERHIAFLSPSFYNALLDLPANVPNGTYLAKTYLFQNGVVLDERAERFVVRTTGVERLLSYSASHSPFLYGLSCVLLALFTGWLGAVAFRR